MSILVISRRRKNRRLLEKLERVKSCKQMQTESVEIVLEINITSSNMPLKCVKILGRGKRLTSPLKGLEFLWATESKAYSIGWRLMKQEMFASVKLVHLKNPIFIYWWLPFESVTNEANLSQFSRKRLRPKEDETQRLDSRADVWKQRIYSNLNCNFI